MLIKFIIIVICLICSAFFSASETAYTSLNMVRMKRMAAQMTAVLYPDAHIRLQLWKMEEGKAYFRYLNTDTGDVVLNRGVFEWNVD